jgi:hypothetical protein
MIAACARFFTFSQLLDGSLKNHGVQQERCMKVDPAGHWIGRDDHPIEDRFPMRLRAKLSVLSFEMRMARRCWRRSLS